MAVTTTARTLLAKTPPSRTRTDITRHTQSLSVPLFFVDVVLFVLFLVVFGGGENCSNKAMAGVSDQLPILFQNRPTSTSKMPEITG